MLFFLVLALAVSALAANPCAWCTPLDIQTTAALPALRRIYVKVTAAGVERATRTPPNLGKSLWYTQFEWEATFLPLPERNDPDFYIRNVVLEKSTNAAPLVACANVFTVGTVYEVFGERIGDVFYVAPCASFDQKLAFTSPARKGGYANPIIDARDVLVNAVTALSEKGDDGISAAQATFGTVVLREVERAWASFLAATAENPTTYGFDFAWLAAGSLVREEMCPFSDLEMLMAVSDKTAAVNKFRNDLAQKTVTTAAGQPETQQYLKAFLGFSMSSYENRFGLALRTIFIDGAINPGYTPSGPERDNLGTSAYLAANTDSTNSMQIRTTLASLRSMTGMSGNNNPLGVTALGAIQTAFLRDHRKFGKAYINLAFNEFFSYLNDNTMDLSPSNGGPVTDRSKTNRIIQMVNVKKALIR